MLIEALLIDLDNTLYDKNTGLATHQAQKCHGFFRERLGCHDEQQIRYYSGLTLDGVREVLTVDRSETALAASDSIGVFFLTAGV